MTLPINQSLQDTIKVVQWAEENGFDDGWFADPGAPDGLTTAAAIAPYTKTLRIGMAIVPVYTRSPTVLAASADILGQALPGRFVLGLGSSSEAILQAFNGIKLEKPLTRVKETAILVRSMMRGVKSDFTEMDTVYSRGYSQDPSEPVVPIYLAALRPKMIEMAAEFGDGVIFNLWPRTALPKMLEHVEIGAKRAGKRLEDVEIVNRFATIVSDDKEAALEYFRRWFVPYFGNPVYNNFLAWCGYPDEAKELLEGWLTRDRARTAAAFHDDLVDSIGVIGTPEEVRTRIKQHADEGITTSIIAPVGKLSLDEAFVTFDAFTQDCFRFD
ncbi:MAG: LLM class flavin-dependent oxidoreductase [Gammaproteobacteria bacterium]|nr:LLM class flavin-dependent oxidoreductase [Gammaproteobacteria bacterium]